MDKSVFMTRYERTHKDSNWARDVESYERAKKALELAIRVKHERSIEYWSTRIQELRAKYPQYLKD